MTAPRIDYRLRDGGFVLRDVRIGIGFHWDRREEQEFEGELEIMHNADGTQTAVNVLDIEDYLTSVISSEMSADSPLELLKAHTVIARSWVLRRLQLHDSGHAGYDVCGDDHCQRYEGVRRRNERAMQAVRETAGEVLMYDEAVCDCRYHKCCGGRTEQFETCWEDVHVPYLTLAECPWCGRAAQMRGRLTFLNDYDRETRDFHDWEVRYTDEELDHIVREKSGAELGHITDLQPLSRGVSGRIYRLRVVGTKGEREIGKELTIRQWLSRSCLYSSWFDVSHEGGVWTLRGHGWGHGVGLCQIGAAVWAGEGADYRTILAHYYPGAQAVAETESPRPDNGQVTAR